MRYITKVAHELYRWLLLCFLGFLFRLSLGLLGSCYAQHFDLCVEIGLVEDIYVNSDMEHHLKRTPRANVTKLKNGTQSCNKLATINRCLFARSIRFTSTGMYFCAMTIVRGDATHVTLSKVYQSSSVMGVTTSYLRG